MASIRAVCHVACTSRVATAAAAFAVAALALAPAASRGDPAPQLVASSWAVGGALGVVFPGTVNSDPGGDHDTKTGFLVQGALDYYVVPRLSTGLFLQYQSVGLVYSGETASVLGVGAAIKARFAIADAIALRPGLSIGYQHGSWSGSTGTTSGLGVGAMVEGVFPLGRSVNGLVQVGFTTQPSGGNKDITLTWAPIFFLAAGVEAPQ
jgi:hypothetical protein